METEAEKLERLKRIIKTRKGTPLLAMGSGIFTTDTRKKMLGIKKQPEPGLKRSQFWYRRRNQVERALVDLMLFLEVSGTTNINQVITKETLQPVVYSLLWNQLFSEGPDVNMAEIAQLFIEEGFNYLSGMYDQGGRYLPLSSKRTIEEAIDLSKYIVYQVEDLKKSARERKELLAKLKEQAD